MTNEEELGLLSFTCRTSSTVPTSCTTSSSIGATETADDEARAVGVPPVQVAKTVALACGERRVRGIATASQRIDLSPRWGSCSATVPGSSEGELVVEYPM
jgi:hypothetical protein